MTKYITHALFSLLLLAVSSVAYSAETVTDSETVLSDNIRRAIITDSIVKREPASDLSNTSISTDVSKVYLFTEVIGKAGTMITHRWFLDGKLEAEVVLKIGGNRWRTNSSKTLDPTMHLGSWQVEVVDEKNHAIALVNFNYGE
ncbi:hypothetical protein GCM10008107_18760 [Psychrosphaera saromensis]|uniref:DUF2914 domain-containing protein n=1 Tax=Psychrosphaera saromensis TaxID=716813 RepID=A0A2S7UTI8_9GAMM|nr:DUF2914 domain-containing protein [Psychrosphaera saromensis]PQJ52590.1 hypothetical protein BTO11_02270 [Psychrosphaera saromensis]GHB69671.1 hypothetical protein GCM10008107_18760 [Psychrosphaera saromensis]GLQ13061.1 hypothetical protein GCM10007917_05160 [Psychrosphaera saromensis]